MVIQHDSNCGGTSSHSKCCLSCNCSDAAEGKLGKCPVQALGATCNAGGGTHMHLLHIADWSHHTQGTSESAQTLQCWQLSDKTYYGLIWIQPRRLHLHSQALGRTICVEPWQRVVWSFEAPFHSILPHWWTGQACRAQVCLIRLILLWDQTRALRYEVMCSNNT